MRTMRHCCPLQTKGAVPSRILPTMKHTAEFRQMSASRDTLLGLTALDSQLVSLGRYSSESPSCAGGQDKYLPLLQETEAYRFMPR